MLQSVTAPTLQFFFFFFFTTFISSISATPIDHSTLKVPRSNPLNIDWSPAPPPEDGPAISAHASRNRDLLPAQISGIVGSYLFSLCVVGTLLLILSRRLRRQVEQEAKALEVELVESALQGVYTGSSGPTPVTPAGLRNFSWPSPDKAQAIYQFPPALNPDPSAFVFPPKSEVETAPYIYPANHSIYSHQSKSSVDNKVVEADREMLARDLEDIYAHVMEQEDAKAAGVDVRSMPPPKIPGASAPAPASAPQSKHGRNKPLKINTSDEKPEKSHSRASSILSSIMSPQSPKSIKSQRKKGIRGLRISSPIASPATGAFSASDEEPLTPISYVHRAPPPIPRNQAPYAPSHVQPESGSPTRSIAETLATETPTTPPGYQLSNQPRTGISNINTRNLHLSLKTQQSSASPLSPNDQSRLPFSHTHTISTSTSIRPMPSKSSLSQSQKPRSQPQNLSPVSQSSTVVSRALPFRQFEAPLASPSFAPSTKTTVLERISPAAQGGLRTGGLKTPFSGGAVPYSPYQPFTPMMPITPRLITKEDRKKMKRAVPRTPVMELIKSEDEIWDSGY